MIHEQHNIKSTLTQNELLAYVCEAVATTVCTMITDFAKLICKKFGFLAPNGEEQITTVIKALRDLEAGGLLTLPWLKEEKKHKYRVLPDPLPLRTPGPEHEAINLVLVTENSDLILQYNTVLTHESPDGRQDLIGRGVSYLVKIGDDVIGTVGFSSARLNSVHRDSRLMIKREEKLKNLHYFIEMRQIFMRKGFEDYLGEVLDAVVNQVSNDFYEIYKYRPIIIEASIPNIDDRIDIFYEKKWQLCSSGRFFKPHFVKKRRRRKKNLNNSKIINKDVKENGNCYFVYVLDSELCDYLNIRPKNPEQALEDFLENDWANREFSNTNFDARSVKVLIELAAKKGEAPGQSLLASCKGDSKLIKSLYRFIESKNTRINFDSILKSHYENTNLRSANLNIRLWPSDGTDINYNNLVKCKGLGYIGTNNKNRGVHLHATLCMSTEEQVYGLGNATIESPEERSSEEKENTNNVSIEDKNTRAWYAHLQYVDKFSRMYPNIKDICIFDRGGYSFEVFYERNKSFNSTDLVVRCKCNQSVLADGKRVNLFEYLRKMERSGYYEIIVPSVSRRNKSKFQKAKKAQKKRKANLGISWTRIKLVAPQYQKGAENIEVTVVHALEKNPPKWKKKVEWVLITTLDIKSLSDAIKCIKYYKARWKIEEYFRILKSGCGVEKLELRTVQRLHRCIAIYLVVAVRCMILALLGRTMPDLPADVVYNEVELQILRGLAIKMNSSHPDTVGAATFLICRLGGYSPRSNDEKQGKRPGFAVFKRGYEILQNGCFCIGLFNAGIM